MTLKFASTATAWLARLRRGLEIQTPPLLFSVLLAASLLIRCGGKVDFTGATASSGAREAGISGPVADRGGASAGGAVGAGGVVEGPGGNQTGAAGGGVVMPVAPTPIDLANCRPSAAAEGCPLPPSACESDWTLAYYTDPACPSGSCQWTQHVRACDTPCVNGWCAPPKAADGAAAAEACTSVEAGACPLPQSVCLDMWELLYFANPQCVAGECRSEADIEHCNNGCTNGACMPVHTH